MARQNKHRDVSDQILGGYNGGIKRNKRKGFGSWTPEKLKEFTKSKKRNERGQFIRETNREKDKNKP